MTDPELSVQAKCLYALLCCYANKERKCFPKKSTLADELNVSFDSIKRYLRELKAITVHSLLTRRMVATDCRKWLVLMAAVVSATYQHAEPQEILTILSTLGLMQASK